MKNKINFLLALVVCNASVYSQNRESIKNFHSLSSKQQLEVQATVYKAGKVTNYDLDTDSGSWFYNDSIRTIYNLTGNPTRSITYFDSGLIKDTSIYNNSGLLISKISFSWNGFGWDTSSVETFAYDSQNLLVNDQYCYYQSGSIAGGYKDVCTYNADNQVILNVSSSLSNGFWIESYKTDFFYNGNDELDKLVSYTWDNTNVLWYKTDSITNIVFQYWAGNIDNSRVLTYLYSEVSGMQILDSLFYDSNNNQVKSVMYELQNGVVTSSTIQKDSYTYDSNNNILENETKMYSGSATADYGYKKVYSDYMPYINTTGIASVKNKTNATIVYPNPNNGTFKVKAEISGSSTIELYSITGEKIYFIPASELPATGEITVPNVPKGIYFMKIADNQKQDIVKIIIQ